MSSDGVILQHRTKLIAHLFVDRSDNLLIGNHIKSLPDDRQPQPTEARRKRLDRQRTGCSICHSDFFTSSLSFSPACLPLGFVQISPLYVLSCGVSNLVNSSCPTSRLTRSQSSRPLPGRLETRREHPSDRCQ